MIFSNQCQVLLNYTLASNINIFGIFSLFMIYFTYAISKRCTIFKFCLFVSSTCLAYAPAPVIFNKYIYITVITQTWLYYFNHHGFKFKLITNTIHSLFALNSNLLFFDISFYLNVHVNISSSIILLHFFYITLLLFLMIFD